MDARWSRLLRTAEDTATPIVIVRIFVGAIFLLEGILKFVSPEVYGVGRFAKLGLPAPESLAPFVGLVEIICGPLVALGLGTRLAAIPLLVIMLVALSTKLPMLSAQGFGTFANAARLDFSLLLSSLFLLITGAGPLSLDARLVARSADATVRGQGPAVARTLGT